MDEFKASGGQTIRLKHVSRRYVEALRRRFSIPDPPTYTFEAAGGVPVTFPHDETTIQTPEEHKAWNDYQRDRLKALADRDTETLRFLITHCIVDDPPPVEEWSVDWERWGIEPPDDSDLVDFKVAWFEHEIASDRDDHARIVAALYEKGGLVDSSRAHEFEAFFRLILEGLSA